MSMSFDARRRAGERLRRYLADPEVKARMVRASHDSVKGKPRQQPHLGASEYNINAKRWYLLAPDKTLYECVNLNHFVREHAGLFAPRDVIWKRKSNGSTTCRAVGGLSNSSIEGYPWKGWRITRDPETLTYWQAMRETDTL